MNASGEHAQHAGGIVCIDWFAQNRFVNHHNRIGAKNEITGTCAPHGERFFPRQSLGTLPCRFAHERSFVDIGRLNLE